MVQGYESVFPGVEIVTGSLCLSSSGDCSATIERTHLSTMYSNEYKGRIEITEILAKVFVTYLKSGGLDATTHGG